LILISTPGVSARSLKTFAGSRSAEIDADHNAAIGGARERLHDGPVGQDIRSHVYFTLSIKATSTCSRFSPGA
jgi:hypothetical protein